MSILLSPTSEAGLPERKDWELISSITPSSSVAPYDATENLATYLTTTAKSLKDLYDSSLEFKKILGYDYLFVEGYVRYAYGGYTQPYWFYYFIPIPSVDSTFNPINSMPALLETSSSSNRNWIPFMCRGDYERMYSDTFRALPMLIRDANGYYLKLSCTTAISSPNYTVYWNVRVYGVGKRE